jgi:hypothetical protein
MDSDLAFAAAIILMREWKEKEIEEMIKKTNFFPVKNGKGYYVQFKNARYIDTGGRDLDHHGKSGKTSFSLALEELGIIEEPWTQTPRKIIYNAERKGISNPFDINEISKSIGRSKLTDREKFDLGVKIAYLVLSFHKEKMERTTEFTRKIIKEFFKDKEMPERFERYFNQLANAKFERPCDLVEIICASEKLYGLEKAKKIGEEILEFLWQEYKKYQEAQKRTGHKKIIIDEKTGNFITFIETSNPKEHVIALKDGALAVIQRNPDGHNQIFFDSKRIGKETTDKIISDLRKCEIVTQMKKRMVKDKSLLTTPGSIMQCPEWHYFLGDAKRNGVQGIFIFNGSLTAPDVPLSKIPIDGIITIVMSSMSKD